MRVRHIKKGPQALVRRCDFAKCWPPTHDHRDQKPGRGVDPTKIGSGRIFSVAYWFTSDLRKLRLAKKASILGCDWISCICSRFQTTTADQLDFLLVWMRKQTRRQLLFSSSLGIFRRRSSPTRRTAPPAHRARERADPLGCVRLALCFRVVQSRSKSAH